MPHGHVHTVRASSVELLLSHLLTFDRNYLDRNNIASAKLANIMEDLNLINTEYQTCVSILFVGYSM